MENQKYFTAHINPLNYPDIDKITDKTSKCEDFIRFACRPHDPNVEDIIKRYKEISVKEKLLFVVHAEDDILTKIVWPLKNAKISYMFGNYLGCIALCGMVSEVAAILIYEISTFRINQKEITPTDEKGLYGREFEKLGQERRIEVLVTLNMITNPVKDFFMAIKEIRNKYLHYWAQEHKNLSKDAIEAYISSLEIVILALGQELKDGKVSLNPKITKYLRDKNMFRDLSELPKKN